MNKSINTKALIEVNSIIERDSKDSTYKFALLKGIIDIIMEYPQLVDKDTDSNRVRLPIGILIFNWIFYYYPIFSSEGFIAQKNGETENSNNLKIRKPFYPLIDFYRLNGGIEKLYNDFKRNTIPDDVQLPLKNLISSIAEVIKTQPMKYLGYSYFGKHYSLTKFNKDNKKIKNTFVCRGYKDLSSLGTFSIPLRYYYVFKNLGQYILGNTSILAKWTDFTLNLKKNDFTDKSKIYNLLLKSPNTERNVHLARNILNSNVPPSLICIWSGKNLTSYALDHIIPFSVWPNNFLWNLMPSTIKINNVKSDKIPNTTILLKSKERIMSYWEQYKSSQESFFLEEIKYSLTGYKIGRDNILAICFEKLLNKCNDLINQGYRSWNY